MEMEFKDTGRRRRVLLVVVGAALALAAGWGAFMLASRGGPQQAVPKKAVLVAAHDITARTQITPDDVVVHEIAEDEALLQAYEVPEDVIGRVTSVPIYTDQQLTPNLFATTSADSDFSILGPDETVTEGSPYWRAVAIRMPPDRAVGGEVQPGQHVDLMVSVDIKVLNQDAEGNYVTCDAASADQFQCGRSTKITFQDVAVLQVVPDEQMYVFRVNLLQAEQISHILQEAPDAFVMALRPDEDTRPIDTSQYGTTTDRLIMYYLYPAPQLIDLSQLGGPLPYPAPGSSPVPGSGGPSTPTATPSPEPGETPGPDASPSAEPASPQPTPGDL